MALYANDRDVLETLLYRRLKTLWHDCTYALAIFSKHRAGTELCGQKVWEALLTAFPLNHKRMQTVLLAKEFSSLMAWDGQPTVASRLGRFSRTPTLIPTTCTTHLPFELCSRPPSLTCLRRSSPTPTPPVPARTVGPTLKRPLPLSPVLLAYVVYCFLFFFSICLLWEAYCLIPTQCIARYTEGLYEVQGNTKHARASSPLSHGV